MAKIEKLASTKEQQAALEKAIESFDKFQDLISDTIYGRNDGKQALWWIYLCSLRVDVSAGKYSYRGLTLRKRLLASYARQNGRVATTEDVRAILTAQDALDESVLELVAADFARLAEMSPPRKRKPRKYKPAVRLFDPSFLRLGKR